MEGDKTQPKIIGYMSGLYAKMVEDATELTGEDGQPSLIWQGRLIETCVSIGIPKGYYKRVVDTLRGMGSIEMLARGKRGASLTAIALRYPPTVELYGEAIVKSGWKHLTANPSPDKLAADVRDILKNIGGINIVTAFKNHEDRVQALETAVEELRQQLSNSSNDNQTNKGE